MIWQAIANSSSQEAVVSSRRDIATVPKAEVDPYL